MPGPLSLPVPAGQQARRKHPHRGLRRSLVAAGGLSLAGALGAETETVADAPTIDEEIVVTGSRIRRDALDARESVLNIGARDRDRTGLTSLGDMLGRLPVSGSSLNTRFNSSGNFGFPADGGGIAAGASHVDLRHLGSKRVLVLVDGLRWVHGSSGSGVSGATDLNTIPEVVVERVEVLRDGASAVYGSDAIAGVVNVVTRSISGLRGRVYGGSHVHGGETVDVEFGFGGTRGKTSASLGLDYTDQQRVAAAEHEQTQWPKPGTGVTHGSTFTPQGRIIVADQNTGTFVNCALNDGVTGGPVHDPAHPCGPDDDYHPWSNADRFNYAPHNLALTPSRRVGSFARIGHAVADNVRLFARLLFNRRESGQPSRAGTRVGGHAGGNGQRHGRHRDRQRQPVQPVRLRYRCRRFSLPGVRSKADRGSSARMSRRGPWPQAFKASGQRPGGRSIGTPTWSGRTTGPNRRSTGRTTHERCSKRSAPQTNARESRGASR